MIAASPIVSASATGPIIQSTLPGTLPGTPTVARSAADAANALAEPAFANLLAGTLSGQPVASQTAVAQSGLASPALGIRPLINATPQPLASPADTRSDAREPASDLDERDPNVLDPNVLDPNVLDPSALAAAPWPPLASAPTVSTADPTASASVSLPAHPQPDRPGQPSAIGAAPGDPLNPVNADPPAIRPDHGRAPSADPANPTGHPQRDPATLADPSPSSAQPTGNPHTRSTDQTSQPAILLASIGREGMSAADREPARLSASETGIEALTGREPTQTSDSSRPSTSTLHLATARPSTADSTEQRAQDIAAQIGWQLGTRINKAEIRLSPPELGSVTIQIEQEGRQLRLDFVAASAEARTALEDTLPKLRDLLATQGHDLVRAQIGTGADPDRRPTANPQQPTRHDTNTHPESANLSISRSTTRTPLGLLDEYA